MSAENCVIVGASHAGVSLALQLRREGWAGTIQLLSDEPYMPYHRPPLSKEVLGGTKTTDSILLRPENAYADNAIELLLNASVTAINPEAHTVTLGNGEQLGYSKLALCTGASVRQLPLAGQRDNVFYIRSASDVSNLSDMIIAGKRAVIIGAGYIGLEAAAQLVQKGVSVTVLEAADRILQRVTAPVISQYYTKLHTSHGVTIFTDVAITAIEGNTNATKVVCHDGSEHETDFIIIGIGITPNVALAEQAGLQVDKGIVVNEYAQTSNADIYAAGDCTQHPSRLYQRHLRLESVQNATDQARAAAANICGKQQVYDAVPWFWSDQYHIKLQTAGLLTGYDAVVVRGDVDNADDTGFAVFYLAEGRVIAADCVNRPKEFMLAKLLIKTPGFDLSTLADESVDVMALIQQAKTQA